MDEKGMREGMRIQRRSGDRAPGHVRRSGREGRGQYSGSLITYSSRTSLVKVDRPAGTGSWPGWNDGWPGQLANARV